MNMLDVLLDKQKLVRTGRTVLQSVLAAVLVTILPMLLADNISGQDVFVAAKVAAVTTVLAYLQPKKNEKPLELPELPKLTEPK